MTNESMVRDLTDAIEIIDSRRLELVSGPEQPWKFLYDASNHLAKERDRMFEAQWSEVMS